MPTAVYTIRVHGRLGCATLSAFPEFDSDVRDGTTLLTGPLTDRSALYGVLGRMEALGLELIEVYRLESPGAGRARSLDPGHDRSPLGRRGGTQPVNDVKNGVPDAQ